MTVLDAPVRAVPLSNPTARALKRAMDLAFAMAGLAFATPFMGLIALAIRVCDGPGVLFRQERLGRDGRPFTLHKFRTMPDDAEATGPVFARQGDMRATRLGSWLRRTSLDELPQLVDVLRGDMSLVGPRPERPVFAAEFARAIPRYGDRHRVKGGLTGWAQVNGLRGDVDIAERTRYDIAYVESWSPLLDLRILAATVAAVWQSPRS